MLIIPFAAFIASSSVLVNERLVDPPRPVEQSAPSYWKSCDLLARPTLVVTPSSTKLPLRPEHVRGENVDPQAV